MGVRDVFFLLGCLLMALAVMAYPFGRWPETHAPWFFRFGLLLAVASHGWPDSLGAR